MCGAGQARENHDECNGRSALIMKSRYLSFAPLSLIVRDPGLRDRDPRILRTFLSSPTAACGRTVIKTGRLLGIIAILDTVGEFAAVPTTGGKSGLCGPESPLSSQIPDGSGGNIERTANSPTVSTVVSPAAI